MAIPVSILADVYSGTPYVKAYADTTETVHHARMTAAMGRLARQVWGADAGVIRLASDIYEFVWCGCPAPTPGFLDGHQAASWHGFLDI